MKKLIYAVAVLATTMLAACGGGSNANARKSVSTLPDDLQDFVFELNHMIRQKLSDNIASFDETYVEGSNLVCQFTYHEDEAGMSLKRGFYRGMTDDDIRQEFIRRINQKCSPENIRALWKTKYNIVARFLGSDSKYELNVLIPYTDL
jgi:hypothetical protein